MTDIIGKEVSIKHVFPFGQRSIFANHMTVQQNAEGEVTISFFEVVPPVMLGEMEERTAQLEKIESVDAECVTRIVITRNRLLAFIGALAESYSNSDEIVKASKELQSDREGKKNAS
jgi:hypothetical protein